MPVESEADRLEFLDDDEFGVVATFGGEPVPGVFHNEYTGADYGSTVQIESADPVFTGRSSDLSAAGQGDAITISGTVFTIRGIEPDGQGMTRLQLADEI